MVLVDLHVTLSRLLMVVVDLHVTPSSLLMALVDFSSLAKVLEECSTIHFSSALLFFFFLVEISLRTLIPLFTPGSVHSGSASSDDCSRMFPDKFRVSSFPDRFPTLCLDSGIVSPARLLFCQGCMPV